MGTLNVLHEPILLTIFELLDEKSILCLRGTCRYIKWLSERVLANLKTLDLPRHANIESVLSLTPRVWNMKMRSDKLCLLYKLKYITTLDISNNNIADITPLSNLMSLVELDISGNMVMDIEPLSKLVFLRKLDASENKITDINPLSDLTSMIDLDMAGNRIVDFNPLSRLTSLVKLDISLKVGSSVIERDLSPLAGCTALRNLWLKGSIVEDIEFVSGLLCLETLDVSQTGIDNIDCLTNLKSLRELCLNHNYEIEDITPISGLTSLERLGLSGNKIKDISPISKLVYLKDLDISKNRIEDITPLSTLTSLVVLIISDNELIQNLTPIAGIDTLKRVYITNTKCIARKGNRMFLVLGKTKQQIVPSKPMCSLSEVSELSDSQIHYGVRMTSKMFKSLYFVTIAGTSDDFDIWLGL